MSNAKRDLEGKKRNIRKALSALAKSLFGVPTSSATAERIFSASGCILKKEDTIIKSR